MHASPSAGLTSTLPEPTDAAHERGSFLTLWLLSLTALLLVFASLLMAVLAGGADVGASVRVVAGGYAILLTAVGLVALAHVRQLGRRSGLLGVASDEPGVLPDAPEGMRVAATVEPRGWPPVSSLARAPRRERPSQALAIATASAQAMRRSMLRSAAAAAARPRPPTPPRPLAQPALWMRPTPAGHLPAEPRGAAPMTRAQLAALQIAVAGPWRPGHRQVRLWPTLPTPVHGLDASPTTSTAHYRSAGLRPPRRSAVRR